MTRRLVFSTLLLLALTSPGAAQNDPRDAYDAALQEIVGAYRLPSGDPLVLRLAYGGGVVARDLATGRMAVLERDPAGGFASGDSISIAVVREADAVRAVRYRPVEGGEVLAPRIPLAFETIRFESEGATLEGTLVLPAGDGPHPAVVVQPGSSWVIRESAESLENAITFAAHGVAGLAYDKRGWGASNGESLAAFETTAGDAAAAARALENRFDVNPRWIGVWGLSQGAWIAPLAASLEDAIRFVVLVGAPGTSPARQEIQRARAKARAEGLSSREVEAAGRFQELSFWYSVTGLGWDAYASARETAEEAPWIRWVWSPTESGFDHFGWGRLNGYYNPLPALLELDEPLLALWGEHDVNVDPEVHRSIFEVALDAAGNPDYTLLVVPGADHVLQVAGSPAAADVRDRIAPGVWTTVVDWIRARTEGPTRSTHRVRAGTTPLE